MSRLHDMGGRFGNGPIPLYKNENNKVEDNEPTFKYDWHAKAWAVTLAAGALGQWNLDISRHYRECLPPKDYMNFSYYEKWLAALTNLLVDKKLVSLDEIKKFVDLAKTNNLDPELIKNIKLDQRTWLAKDVQKTLGWGGPSLRSTKNEPIYKIGDNVITLKHNPNKDVKGGHTRLPTYAMGKMGKVYSYNGSHVLPDTNAHGNGETPTPLYTVEFKAIELWGTSAENENDLVYLDLWEPYFTLNTE